LCQLELDYFYADIPRRSREATRQSSLQTNPTALQFRRLHSEQTLSTLLSPILAHCFRPISLLNHLRIQSLRRSSPSSVWTVPEASNSQFQIPQSPPRIPERAFTHHSTSPNCSLTVGPKYRFAGKSCTAFQISRRAKPLPTSPLLSNHDVNHHRSRQQNMANENQSDQQTRALESWETSASSPNPAAMSAASPTDQYGNKSGGSGYGSGQSDNGKSPLSMSLGFLKNLTEKKNTRGE
jgi:hypothetical protein